MPFRHFSSGGGRKTGGGGDRFRFSATGVPDFQRINRPVVLVKRRMSEKYAKEFQSKRMVEWWIIPDPASNG